jgi:hypothetical protein
MGVLNEKRCKKKLNSCIEASKIDIDNGNIEHTNRLMKKQLSSDNIPTIKDVPNITLYHMESLYRDNTLDKYMLI